MRSVPETFLKASFARETDCAFIALVTISHPELAAPIRVSTDSQDIQSRGMSFVSYPFEVYLPSDEDGRPPLARMRLDNLDQDISTALRSITTPADVLIEMILSSNWDEIVTSFTEFKLTRADYDVMTIEGDLSVRSYGIEPYPALLYSPVRFPSMFRGI